jgi:hypothetical protein
VLWENINPEKANNNVVTAIILSIYFFMIFIVL